MQLADREDPVVWNKHNMCPEVRCDKPDPVRRGVKGSGKESIAGEWETETSLSSLGKGSGTRKYYV